jgi:hypothetical protein
MFYLDVVVVCRCVSSTDVFLWGSYWSFIDEICVLLACKYVIAFLPCLCFVFFDKCCLLCVVVVVKLICRYITELCTAKKISIPICKRWPMYEY